MTARQTAAAAIARYLHPGAPDDCWPWRGTRDSHGYGVASIVGKQQKAHRISYEAYKGAIPAGLFVRHTCDNPPCCNPHHLLVGTPRDNMDDKVQRGRQALGRRIGNAVLTETDVIAIRARYEAGDSLAAIARDFRISDSHAGRVARGLYWKHVQETAA